ncbi:MAG: NADH-quinone oxidoreductase subunit B [Actinobacteria bacterium]|nr:MAG: NADH-quinone oxidoreductase subunit B [Actinomycetota bacterium]
MGVDNNQSFVATAKLDKLLNQGRGRSMWVFAYSPACCAIEGFMHAGGPRWDFDRYGFVPFASPRHADLMIVGGPITRKMVPVIRRLYQQMPEPKWVIAMGACSCSGGLFKDSYNVVQGVDKILPVEVYVPGCPPRPEGLWDGLLKLRQKIINNEPMRYMNWQPLKPAKKA